MPACRTQVSDSLTDERGYAVRNVRSFLGGVGALALTLGLVVAAPTAAHAANPQTIQILGINDFHGRIAANQTEAGAAVLAGAVTQLRADHPDTVFAAAGDLIGASTFVSFVAHDKPTIDALNAAGLEVSAVGNHEFDQGYSDLVDRVMAPYDATTNPYGGAEWEYLGANVRNAGDGSPALPESWIQDFGDVQVGFVGAVTEHLSELVSPAGIAGLEIEDIVTAANRTADELKADGADLVVLLVHEGAATTALESATDPTSDFGKIVNGVDGDIDAIVSGHTHLAYNHAIPVQEWIDEGRAVTTRPVVSAGQYGYNLNQLLFEVDPDTGRAVAVSQAILPLVTTVDAPGPPPTTTYVPNYPADPGVAEIVDEAVEEAAVLGAVPLGEIAGPFNRAKLANGTTENRGGESTLGNLVAEAQQTATEQPAFGGAQLAFMNPGGLRQDMVGNNSGGYPAVLTYAQAAIVQPFANTLVNMTLTGGQIKAALEQQWQPAGSARPFLRLGISEGFRYTYDPTAADGSRVTGMWLDDEPVAAGDSFSVTVNSFLAAGGDNFGAFATGTNQRDTGQVDLQAMVDYMGDADGAVAPDFTQRSVGIDFGDDAPASYRPGDQVSFDVSSLAFSTAADTKDATIDAALDGVPVGSFAVDNTIGTDVFDEYGKASVSFTVPAGTAPGRHVLTLTGTTTGSVAEAPLTVAATAVVSSTTLSASSRSQTYDTRKPTKLTARVTVADRSKPSGTVTFTFGDTVLGTAQVRAKGKGSGEAKLTVPPRTPVGSGKLVATFTPVDPAKVMASSSKPIAFEVRKSKSAVIASACASGRGKSRSVTVVALVVLDTLRTPQGRVSVTVDGKQVGSAALRHGLARVSFKASSAGSKRIVVTYRPADPASYVGSSRTLIVRV